MLTLKALREYGANTDEGLARCLNKEDFYLRMVSMLRGDTHAAQLLDAVRRDDLKAAFEAAHALKGSLANLSLTPALDAVTCVLEPLRRGEARGDYEALALKVCAEMDRLQALLDQ